jgi:simple sugar transport system substrate-binding protein
MKTTYWSSLPTLNTIRTFVRYTGQTVAVFLLAMVPLCAADAPLKVAFLYPGPVGDFGYSYSHDQARLLVEKALPQIKTIPVESVTEADLESNIDLLVQQGVKVIFTTSYGFMDGTILAAKRHPDIIFANGTGFKRAPNVATFQADTYQGDYLNGLMAGALTKTGKIGYVGPYPTSDTKHVVNAFALGIQTARPDAKIFIRWINDWYNPPAAKEASEALIADGVDVLNFTEDSPTVVQTAASHHLLSFSVRTPMYDQAPKSVASGILVHWESFYIDFLKKVIAGEYTSRNLEKIDFWGRLADGSAELAAKPGLVVVPEQLALLKAFQVPNGGTGKMSAWDLIQKRLAEMKQNPPLFDPYQGPVRDRQGVIRIPAGRTLTHAEMISIDWAAGNIVGPWPNEPPK